MSVDARAFVRVVVKNNLGDILVIRHRLNSLWNLPGGKVELGESLETAAVRELWEETGIVAIRLVPLFATSIISEGGIWTGHFFAALAAIPGVELRECTKAVEIRFVSTNIIRELECYENAFDRLLASSPAMSLRSSFYEHF